MQLSAWWFDARVSLMTGLVLAVWLELIEFTTILATELVFCALVLAALVAWAHPAHGWIRRAVTAGVLLAAACYVRPVGLALPIVFLGLEWLRTRKKSDAHALKHILIPTALLGIVMAAAIAPWSLRNTMLFGRFVLIETNGGVDFWIGNNPNATGEWMDVPAEFLVGNEAEQDAHLTALTLDAIRARPLAFGLGIVKKVILIHSRKSIGAVWNQDGLAARWGEAVLVPLKAASTAYWYAVLALALTAIALLYKQSGWVGVATQPTIWLWIYFTLTHAVILAQDRYHIPSAPVIAMLAGYTLVYLYDAWRVRHQTGASVVHESYAVER